MSSRKSLGSSEDQQTSSSRGAGSKRKSSSKTEPIKLPRLAVISELEEKYQLLASKSIKAAEKAASSSSAPNRKQQLTAIFEGVKSAAFGLLKANVVSDAAEDEDEIEELDRDLAREVDTLKKQEEKLAKAVKELRDKHRTGIPAQVQAAYAARLAALTASPQDEEEDEEDDGGAEGEDNFFTSPRRKSGSGAGAAPTPTSSKSKGSRAGGGPGGKGGRKSLAAARSTSSAELAMASSSVPVAQAGYKQQLKVLRETAADVGERALALKRALPTIEKDIQDVIAVQSKKAKKAPTDAAIAAAATIPTPGRKAR